MIKDPALAVGGQVRKLRQQHGLTQEALAEAAQLSPDHLSRLERGKKQASLDTARRLADALGVTVDALLGDSQITDRGYEAYPEMRAVLRDCTRREYLMLNEIAQAVKSSVRRHT